MLKSFIGGTDIVRMSYKSSDAELAEKVINAWIEILNIEYAKNLRKSYERSNDILYFV